MSNRVGIVGGGPAGLAAAMALRDADVRFSLFESGQPLGARRHDHAQDLGVGIGGAGLFSDGKFSFYPSGTHLYELKDPVRLRRSYDTIARIITRSGIDAPPFPELDWSGSSRDGFSTKDYRSSYGTLAQRIRLVEALSRDCADSITTDANVLRITRHGDEYVIGYDSGGMACEAGPFDRLILATGRFGAMALHDIIDGSLPLEEQRYEVGIRLEHPDHLGFLRHSSNADVKFILREEAVEIRTFCTCRYGEVWMIPYDGISALSGRSDGPPSRYCNFGLLPRFSGNHRAVGRDVWQTTQSTAGDRKTALWQSLPEFLDGPSPTFTQPAIDDRPWHPRDAFVAGDVAGALHPELRAILRGGLRAILERFPDLYAPETICLYPAIEGVGNYPDTDGDMRIAGDAIWCCGDVAGRFRGLIPALVSGHYVGSDVADQFGPLSKAGRPCAVTQFSA